jgi:S1-C subfamily serine protease
MRIIYFLVSFWFISTGLHAQNTDSSSTSGSFIIKFNSLDKDLQHQLDSLIDIMGIQQGSKFDLHSRLRSNSALTGNNTKPFLGIVFESNDAVDGEKSNGVKIIRVVEGSCAATAGLNSGDIITHLDEFPINSVEAVISALNNKKAGEAINIKYKRDDINAEVVAILQSKQEGNLFGRFFEDSQISNPDAVSNRPLFGYAQMSKPRLGIQISDIDVEARKSLKLKKGNGALINQVESKSPSEKMGLKPNDLIIAMNGKTINSSEELISQMRSAKLGDAVSLTYIRNGKKKTAHGELTSFNAGWQPEDHFKIFRFDDDFHQELQQELEELRNKVKSLEEELNKKGK